jgi:fatty acid desaturase
MTAESRQLNTRADTELLNVMLSAYDRVTSVSSPLGQAWRDAARALGESTAGAFLFIVVLLPWLPLVALGVWMLTLLWRLVRFRRKAKVAGA